MKDAQKTFNRSITELIGELRGQIVELNDTIEELKERIDELEVRTDIHLAAINTLIEDVTELRVDGKDDCGIDCEECGQCFHDDDEDEDEFEELLQKLYEATHRD